MKVSPQLFMSPKQISPKSPHECFNTSWSPMVSQDQLLQVSLDDFNNASKVSSINCSSFSPGLPNNFLQVTSASRIFKLLKGVYNNVAQEGQEIGSKDVFTSLLQVNSSIHCSSLQFLDKATGSLHLQILHCWRLTSSSLFSTCSQTILVICFRDINGLLPSLLLNTSTSNPSSKLSLLSDCNNSENIMHKYPQARRISDNCLSCYRWIDFK